MKVNIPFFRTAFNYDTQKVSSETDIICEEKTLTQQQFKDEVDINEILRRFNITGQLPTDFNTPQFGDYTGITDFHTAMNAVVQARTDFMSLPAFIRDRFNNDPQQLLEFVSDNENYDEAAKLGLVPRLNPSSDALDQNKPESQSGGSTD